MPKRIQLRRTKGWRMPAGAVSVARGPGRRWGNPFDFRSPDYSFTALAFGFQADPPGRRAASVEAFRRWITPSSKGRLVAEEFQVGFRGPEGFVGIEPRVKVGAPPTLEEIRRELGGRDLACWCGSGPCHAEVLLEIANGAGEPVVTADSSADAAPNQE